MDAAIKHLPKTWDDFKNELENRLALLRTEEPNTLKMASKAILLCTDMTHLLSKQLIDYHFAPGEEILFYKDIKPFFISRLIYFTRLHNLEMQRSIVTPTRTEDILNLELDHIEDVYQQNLFIYRYLKNGATHLDDKLFFHPTNTSATALYGMDFPYDSGYPVCFDHVVAQLQAADMLRKYVDNLLDDLRYSSGHAAQLPRLVWTDSKTALIEQIYAWHAADVFNNGKIDLKDIVDFVQATFKIDLGHYPRTFQEILARKKGYTTALDRYREKLLLRIQKIEEKYDR